MSEHDCVPERAAIKWLEEQLDIARADNKRLRAALEKIAHLTPMILTGADSPAAHLAQRMGVIATDALEQKTRTK